MTRNKVIKISFYLWEHFLYCYIIFQHYQTNLRVRKSGYLLVYRLIEAANEASGNVKSPKQKDCVSFDKVTLISGPLNCRFRT